MLQGKLLKYCRAILEKDYDYQTAYKKVYGEYGGIERALKLLSNKNVKEYLEEASAHQLQISECLAVAKLTQIIKSDEVQRRDVVSATQSLRQFSKKRAKEELEKGVTSDDMDVSIEFESKEDV